MVTDGDASAEEQLARIRACWPPSDSGAGPATGREDLTGTVVLDVLDLGTTPSGAAAIALAEFPSPARVQAVPLVSESNGWRRADAGDGVSAALVELLDPAQAIAESGSLSVRAWSPPDGRIDGEQAITGDQTNESVVVGEAAVVKWLRPVPEATSRALLLTSHLASVGFTGIPRPLGVLVWRSPSGADVALAHFDAFLPGAKDGYTWCVDALLDHLRECTPECAPGHPSCGAWFGEDLGRLTAELHAALASPSDVLAGGGRRTNVARFRPRAEQVLATAVAEAEGEAVHWLADHADAVRRAFATLPATGETPASPIHGDLHVGQVLRWDGGLAVIDFDGNPTLEDHALAEPTARDVAQMTCSIDHLGRIADRRTERRQHDRIEQWVTASRACFLDAYGRTLGALGHADLFDARLLTGFEVEQECRELIYAGRYLPRWTYAPLGALAARFGED